MNVYKEIFIELEKSIKTELKIFDYYSSSDSKGKSSLTYENRKRGFVYSFNNMIVTGKVEFNIINLMFLKLKYDNLDKSPFYSKKFRIIFPDLILDNIYKFPDTEKEAQSINFIFFTVNGKIFNLNFGNIFEIDYDYSKNEGEFNSNLDIMITENIGYDGYNHYFSLGSGNGKFYFYRLYFKNGNVISEVLYEYKSNFAITRYIGSFFTNEKFNNGISHLKNIGNKMICYLTYDFNFNIFTRFSNKVIFSKSLVKNKKNEVIKFSKISYFSDEIDIDYAQTKSYFFSIYVEYDTYFLQFTFEIWFSNIETHQYRVFSKNFDEKLSSNDNINLGENVSLTNFRVYNLKGKLIDMISYEKKIWIISENTFNESVSYDFKIISINNSGKFKNLINLSEMKMTNTLMTLISQVKTILDKEKKSQLILSILSNDDLVQGEFFLDYWNNTFQKFLRNTDCHFFNQKSDLINFLTKVQDKAEILDKIIENIYEIMSNDVICFGAISTNELNSLIVLRENGFSYIRETGKFEYLNELISIHESKITDIIFEKNNYKISNTFIKNLNYIKQKVFNYIMLNLQQKEDNSFYIILSLLRLTMSESLIKMNDLNYISRYFSKPNANLNQFIEEHFSDSCINTNITNLEFLNEFIYTSITNNMHIEKTIEKIILYYFDYMNTIYKNNINYQIEKSNEHIKYNNKYCEVISKLINEKIKSMYYVTRDLLMLICWFKKFSDINLITNPNTALFNEINFRRIYDKFYEKIIRLFIDCFSAFIICFTQINITKFRGSETIHFVDKKSMNFDISISDFVLYKNLNQYGNKIFEDLSNNKIIDYLISYFWPSFKIIDVLKINSFIIKTLFFEFEDYKSVRILINIQNEQILENIWYLILSNAFLQDIDQMKESINLMYCTIMDKILNASELSSFESFLCENRFIQRKQTEKFTHQLLVIYKYLEESIKKILKEEDHIFQFYHFSSFYIIPLFSKIDKKNNSKFLYHIFELSLKMDMDCSITCLISIEDLELKKKGFETFVEYSCQTGKIDNLLNYNFDKNQYELIFSILDKKSKGLINQPEHLILKKSLTPVDENNNLNYTPDVNYLFIYLSLLSVQNDYYNYARVLNSYVNSLNILLKKQYFNLPELTKIYKEILSCLTKIKTKNISSNFNFIPLFSNEEICSYEKCLKSIGKIKAKYHLLRWNEGPLFTSRDLGKRVKISDKFDQKTVTDDNLMVDFICSKSFEDEFFTFLNETQYIEYLTQEITDQNSLNLQKIFNCIIENQLVPRCYRLNKEDDNILFKVYLNYNIYELNNEIFYNFFTNILLNIPSNYALQFAELIFIKNLNIPQILSDYLSENQSINFMRLLLKFHRAESCFNLISKLILDKKYVAITELNLLKNDLNSKAKNTEKDFETLSKIQKILNII